MRSRCRSSTANGFKNYGGRGIKVCARWDIFENFLADMGERPEGTTLDRWPNNDGDYEPGNCKWSTKSEQQQNTRTVVLLENNGEKLSIGAWSRKLGITRHSMQVRLRNWPLHKALTEPMSDAVKRGAVKKRLGARS